MCRSHPVYDYNSSLVMLQITWNRAQVSTSETAAVYILLSTNLLSMLFNWWYMCVLYNLKFSGFNFFTVSRVNVSAKLIENLISNSLIHKCQEWLKVCIH